MAIRTRADLLEVDHGLNTSELTRTSRLVSSLTGYSVQKNKAVVGSNAFAHESGIHQHGVLQDRQTYEIMRSEDVGAGGSKIVLGKHSGRHAFKDAIDELGFELDDAEFQSTFTAFKTLADRKGEIGREDLRALIVAGTSATEDDEYSIVSFQASGGTATAPTATVEIALRSTGATVTGTATGDGMVDAACSAIRDATERTEVKLVGFQVSGVGEGIDALGEVQVTVSVQEGERFTGRGVSTDIVEASARAYLDALNRSRRITHRQAEFRP